VADRVVCLSSENLAVIMAAGHPLYLIKTPDAASWDYQRPITIRERPDLIFKRHLLMFANRGHAEALELELTHGPTPTRLDLLGMTLVQA
jgi:hypothetical protein